MQGRTAGELLAWMVAAAWCVRVSETRRRLPQIEDLTGLEWDVVSAEAPRLTVVVPARNEADNIEATLRGLLAADYPRLEIVAVDDRSEDATGRLMDAVRDGEAAQAAVQGRPARLRVLHIDELPEGWLGKTWALASGVGASQGEYLLFTDADVLFSPSVLRRAVAYAELTGAAHLVIAPTPLLKSWGEGAVLGFFQVLGLWATRPWRIADPRNKREAIGIGAFNLLRRDALESLGGLEPQRMVVLEDLTLGRRVKAAGLPQRMAFARGLVLVHWANGVRGLVGVMTKNLFSATNFQPGLMLLGSATIAVFALGPVAGLFWWGTLGPSLLVLACVAVAYRELQRVSGVPPRYGWLFPVGGAVFCWAMLRSMVVVVAKGGVVWRGTHYPLWELRLHNSPGRWRRRQGI